MHFWRKNLLCSYANNHNSLKINFSCHIEQDFTCKYRQKKRGKVRQHWDGCVDRSCYGIEFSFKHLFSYISKEQRERERSLNISLLSCRRRVGDSTRSHGVCMYLKLDNPIDWFQQSRTDIFHVLHTKWLSILDVVLGRH